MTRTDTAPPAPSADPVRRSGRPLPPWAVLTVTPLLRWLVATRGVPYGEPDRHACPRCAEPIARPGPLRALSPVGRCAGCAGRIGAPPGAVELALLAVAVLLLVGAHPLVESLALAWWYALAIPLAFIDLAVHRLPDRLTYPAAIGTLGLLGLAALLAGDLTPWVRALLAGVGTALVFAGSTLLLGPRSFGLGDAKLALSSVAILGWLGWPWLLPGLMVAFGGSGLTALVLLLARRIRWSGHLPFGPFLILGTTAALLLAG